MLGKSLGPYRIDEEIGGGGMGTVYLAEVTGDAPGVGRGDRVALKLVHPHLLSTPGFFKRFLREAEIGQAVRHANVVRTFDCDALLSDGQQQNFLVMEYVEGQTLRELLDELERVPEELCRHIGLEVAKGLDAIHAAGAVHRDIKPENALITGDHVVKLMDLGVARLADEAMRLSQTGMFVGSILYAAPEQFLEGAENLDGRADLYALGLLLYELSTGRHPHPGKNFTQVLAQVLENEPPRVGNLNPQLSPFFEEVVHTLIARERGDRFATASALVETLEAGEKSTWWRSLVRSIRKEPRKPIRRILIPKQTPVHGRQGELDRLRSLYEEVRQGQGRVVFIEGEVGIGKTRLVDELIESLRQDGEFHFLFGSFPPGGAATEAGAFNAAYREHFGDEDIESELSRHLHETPSLVAPFAGMLRGAAPAEGAAPLTKGLLQTAFVETTRSLARELPTIVMIDDLHFTSKEGHALFAALAHAAPGHRLLLIGTSRRGISEDWVSGMERLSHFSRIVLSRLGEAEVASLLEHALSSATLARDLAPRITVKSGGNPFFVFEIIQDLRDGGGLAQLPDGSWTTTAGFEQVQVPTSVRDLFRGRIADLDEEERELIDVAACCGAEFDASLVADALSLPRVPALRRFAHIEREHRIVHAVGRLFAFDHYQIREVIYESLPEVLREEYHSALGRALKTRAGDRPLSGSKAVDACSHLLRGGLPEDAVRHLDPALEYLESNYLLDIAVELAMQVASEPDLHEPEPRLRLLLRIAAWLNTLGRREEEEAILDQAQAAAERIGDASLRARSLAARGWFMIQIGRYDEACESLLRALDLARECGDEKEEARASRDTGIALFCLGRYMEAMEHHQRHLGLSRELGDARGEASATGNLGNVMFVLGRLDEAREHYERWLATSREIGDRRGEAAATGNLGAIHQTEGRFGEALDNHTRNRTLTSEIGYAAGEARAQNWIGCALRALGRYADAREEFTRYSELSRAIGLAAGEVHAAASLAELCAELGEAETARAHLMDALHKARELGTPDVEVDAREAAGKTELLFGRIEEAERWFREVLEIRRNAGTPVGVARTQAALGQVLMALGREEEASPILAEAQAAAEERDEASTVVHTLLLRTLLGECEPSACVERFADLAPRLEHGERMEARFLLWRVTGDPDHLADSHRLLSERLEEAAEGSREASLLEVRLHLDIDMAYREQFQPDGG